MINICHNIKNGLLAMMVILLLNALAACDNEIPTVSLGLDDYYRVERMKKLDLNPALTGADYRWTITRPDGTDSVIDGSRRLVFLTADEGRYKLRFDIIDPETPVSHTLIVDITHEEVEYSPYIANVLEYCPAPGQFVNDMPRYDEGDTAEDMARKATECISGTNDVMISLGAYGGYVTFAFDHTVVNLPGNDIRIWGNCFYEAGDPESRGGSAEPGIIMVCYDANANGLPDDPWYELAGSEYYSKATRHNYSVTYTRHDPTATPVSDGSLDDVYYIPWTDSEGEKGYVSHNIFHEGDYWPKWLPQQTLTFTGSCLAQNAKDLSGEGTYYVLYSYPWGYVDNHPNDYADLNSFDISNAVDDQGRPVKLPGADWIRVYTGINQYCGWLGETSTELSRAADLHVIASSVPTAVPKYKSKTTKK